MAKKVESKTSISSHSHYYVKDHFVEFAKPENLQKSITKVHFYSADHFIEIYEPKDHHLIDGRSSWYDAIESGKLKPSMDQDGNVRILSGSLTNSQHAEWCEHIEIIANRWVERENYKNSQVSDKKNIDLILEALAQLTRYLPELQEKQPNYFLDTETYKIGVTLQGEGTLTLLIGANSEVEYSYAQRQDKGTVRISGIAKLTTNIRNSKNIRKLIKLQGIVE